MLNNKIIKLEKELNINQRLNPLDEKYQVYLIDYCKRKIDGIVETLRMLLCSYNFTQSNLHKKGYIGNNLLHIYL